MKGNERNRRGKQTGIVTDVLNDDQALPVEMDKIFVVVTE